MEKFLYVLYAAVVASIKAVLDIVMAIPRAVYAVYEIARDIDEILEEVEGEVVDLENLPEEERKELEDAIKKIVEAFENKK